MTRGRFWAALAGTLLAGAACSPEPPGPAPRAAGAAGRPVDPPAAAGALAPELGIAAGELALSWLEPAEAGHRLRFSRLGEEGWSRPATVAEGGNFFANWADFPRFAETSTGTLLAHWLEKTAPETYAYSIRLARSADGGRTWLPLATLHDDDSPTEHGFVSYAPAGGGAVRAFWLDGRGMLDGGPMALRAARVDGAPGASTVLDGRVCECCQTGAAWTHAGPVVVYRDRSEEEVRDIYIVRETGGGFTEPRPVHADGWRIPGCPVNGPAVAAEGEGLAVAWFSAPGGGPRVQVAFSGDGGATFREPVRVDGGRPLGRVDVVLDGFGSAVVSWLEISGGEAEVRLRRVAPGGRAGEPLVASRTSQARSSGFPRLERLGERLGLAWVEAGDEDPQRLRFLELPLEAVPR